MRKLKPRIRKFYSLKTLHVIESIDKYKEKELKIEKYKKHTNVTAK